MSLFNVRQADPPILTPEVMKRDFDLDEQLRGALARHKEASDGVVRRSLDQVQRAADVAVAVQNIVGKLEASMSVDTAHGAYDLVSRGPHRNEDHPPI